MILIVGGLVFVLYNLDSLINKNKGVLLSQIEKSLNRKVSVQQIGLSVFGGLGLKLHDFTVQDDSAFSKKPFVQTRALVVNVEFWPLLKKELKVKKLILSEPVIAIIRDKSDQYNFSTIGSSVKKGEKENPKHKDKELGDLFVSFVDISSGKVFYIDRKEGKNLEITQIDLRSQDISLDKPISINLAMALLSKKQNVAVKGDFGPFENRSDLNNLLLNADVLIDSLNIGELKKKLTSINNLIPSGLGLNGPLSAKFNVSRKSSSGLQLKNIDIDASVFGATKPNLKALGSLGPIGAGSNSVMDIDFELGPVAFEKLRDFKPIGNALPRELKVSGPLSASGKFSGPTDNLKIDSLVLEASSSSFVYGNLIQKQKDKTFTFSTDALLTKQSITLENTSLKLNEQVLNVAGRIGFSKSKDMDLKVSSSDLDLLTLSENVLPLRDYNLFGTAKINADLSGTTSNPEIVGTVKLTEVVTKVAALPKPISGINGVINFTGKSAKFNGTDIHIGNSKMRLSADITNFSPLTTKYSLTSSEVLLVDIIEDSKPGETLESVKVDGLILPDGSHKALISSNKGKISSLKYDGLNGNVVMKDNVVNFNNLTFEFFNASLNVTGRYDMGGQQPRFNLNTSVQGLNVTDIIKSFANPSSDHIKGKTNLKLEISGSGSGWEEISETLDGIGNIELTEGELTDFNVVEEVLTGITGIQGLSGLLSSNLKDKYPEIFKTTNTVFYNLNTPIKINDGKINFSNLLLKATGYFVKSDGWVSLNSGLNANGVMILSEKITKDLVTSEGFLKYLENDSGQLQIPFKLEGVLPNVTPQPDVAFITRLLQKAAVDKGKGEIKKKILESIVPKDKEGLEQEQEETKTTDEKIKDLIPFPKKEKKKATEFEKEKMVPKKKKEPNVEGLIEEGLDKVLSF